MELDVRIGGLVDDTVAGLGDHVGGGVSSDDASKVRRQRARDVAWTAAEVKTQTLRPAVVGEDGLVQRGGVGGPEGGVGGGREGGLSGIGG